MGSLSHLQQIFPTQESNQGPLHCRQFLYPLSYQGSSRAGCPSPPRGPSQPRDGTRTSCSPAMASGLFITEPPGKPHHTHNCKQQTKAACRAPGHRTARSQPGLAVAGGIGPSDTQIQGHALPHRASPNRGRGPQRQAVWGAWLEPPSPHPRPQLPDPPAPVLVHRESSPGIWRPLFPFDRGQSVWPR